MHAYKFPNFGSLNPVLLEGFGICALRKFLDIVVLRYRKMHSHMFFHNLCIIILCQQPLFNLKLFGENHHKLFGNKFFFSIVLNISKTAKVFSNYDIQCHYSKYSMLLFFFIFSCFGSFQRKKK